MKILKRFTDKKDKEKIFDLFISKMVGTEKKQDWISDDKEYVYGKDGSNYCIEINKPQGTILRRFYHDDRIGDVFNIEWSVVFGR